MTHTRTHTAHTCTRDDFWRTPLHSGPRHTGAGTSLAARVPGAPLGLLRNSTPGSESGLSEVNTFFRPEKQTRRNNKKISLHRFKPIILSKMIQNGQNQVEGGGCSRLIGERGAPPRQGGRRPGAGSLGPASVSPSASLPGPRAASPRGPRCSPGGGSAGSLSGLV